jgi:hypothetical protein
MMSTRALLSHCIDYAGLFPPSQLDLQTTVNNYASYLTGSQAWALGRLILPATGVGEFAKTWPSFARKWPIGLLVGADVETELRHATDCDYLFDVVECKPLPAREIATIHRLIPAQAVYFEVPADSDPEEWIVAIASVRSRAKIRTGGVTPDTIPSVTSLARFLSCCVRHGVPFKATGGLHHPIRALRPLTYESQSEQAVMHGFVNVILASSILHRDGDIAAVSALLEDASPANFRFDEEHIRWRDWSFTTQQLVEVRENLMMSFGSCSFVEPLFGMNWIGSLS